MIQRQDSQLILSLRDGDRVLFRPITPEDRDRIVRGMLMLSPESRYLRFFSPVSRLSDKQLDHQTEVDQHNHVAWGALDPDNFEHPGFGIARFIRLPDDPISAEMAVTVLDAYQKKGIGTLLLAVMYLRAIDVGVKNLLGNLLPENKSLITWLNSLHATSHYEDGMHRMRLPVYPNYAEVLNRTGTQKFIKTLDYLSSLLTTGVKDMNGDR